MTSVTVLCFQVLLTVRGARPWGFPLEVLILMSSMCLGMMTIYQEKKGNIYDLPSLRNMTTEKSNDGPRLFNHPNIRTV